MASHMMDVQEDDPMSAGDVAAAAADHPEDAARYVINNNQKRPLSPTTSSHLTATGDGWLSSSPGRRKMTRVGLVATTPWGSNRQASLPQTSTSPSTGLATSTPSVLPLPREEHTQQATSASAGYQNVSTGPSGFEGPFGSAHGVQEKWAAAAAAAAAVEAAARRVSTEGSSPGLPGADTGGARGGRGGGGEFIIGGDSSGCITRGIFASRGFEASGSRLPSGCTGAATMEVESSCSRRASAAFGVNGTAGDCGALTTPSPADPAAGGDVMPKVIGGGLDDAIMGDDDGGGSGGGGSGGPSWGREGGERDWGSGGGSITALAWVPFPAHPPA